MKLGRKLLTGFLPFLSSFILLQIPSFPLFAHMFASHSIHLKGNIATVIIGMISIIIVDNWNRERFSFRVRDSILGIGYIQVQTVNTHTFSFLSIYFRESLFCLSCLWIASNWEEDESVKMFADRDQEEKESDRKEERKKQDKALYTHRMEWKIEINVRRQRRMRMRWKEEEESKEWVKSREMRIWGWVNVSCFEKYERERERISRKSKR